MPPDHRSPRRRRSTAFSLALAAGLLTGWAVPAALAQEEADKSFSFFVGADFQAQVEGALFPVIGIDDDEAVLRKENGTENLWLKEVESYQIDRSLKLTSNRVELLDFEAKPLFARSAESQREWMRSQMAMDDMQQTNLNRAVSDMNRIDTAVAKGTMDSATLDRMQTNNTRDLSISNGDFNAPNKLISARGLSRDNALDLSFDVTAPAEMKDAYLVAEIIYLEPGEREVPKVRIVVRDLGTIGLQPERVEERVENLPEGFELVQAVIHIYRGGTEFATNLSEKRLDVSREDAFTYLLFGYLEEHSGESRPPVVAIRKKPSATSISQEQARMSLRIQVDEEGRVLGIEADGGKVALDADLRSAVEGSLFFPALEKGEPVTGTLSTTLAELFS